MVDVRSLSLGFFIASIFIALSLWVNSLVNSSVIELDFTQPRAVATTKSVHSTVVSAETEVTAEAMVDAAPTTFSNLSYTWSAPKTSEVQKMKALISSELSEYSQQYLNDIGLRKVTLVDNIQNKANQPVLGFSDPLKGEIYLNTVELEGEFSRSMVAEQTVHHEIAHLLAYSEYGYWFDRDSGWQELGGNYSYGEAKTMYKEYFPRDGFVSRYSMTSPGEDFAEIYSLIYTEYFKEKLAAEAKNSELLGSKTKFVYETISGADPAQCRASFSIFDRACD